MNKLEQVVADGIDDEHSEKFLAERMPFIKAKNFSRRGLENDISKNRDM